VALSLGTVVGQIRIDISQASAAYAALRAEHATTMGALNGSAASFSKAGVAMAGAGAVMVGAFAAAAGAAAEFEKRLDFFGAVSNTTAGQMEAVRAKALQLGKDTKYSANEIADSFIELGKAGVSASDIIGGVGEAVAHLGASADIPLADAANIITSQIQAFNLSAKDAVHVADELQGAANASIADVQDLGVSLKYVGGVAAAVHIPFESVVDAISLLAKAGIRGSTAGTSLRQILVSLQGNSKKATAELKELGIITADGTNKFIDQAGHIKPLSEVFQILQDHTKGLTEAQRLQAFKIIFNNRALAAAAILTKEGANGFKEMNKAIAGTTAADVAAKRMDNLSGDIEILRGNIETLLIQAGTPFQNFLRGIVKGLTAVIQFFGNLPAPIQTAIFAFLGIAGALLLMVGAFNIIFGTIFKFVGIMIRLGEAFSFVSRLLSVVRGAFVAFNLVLLANPIVLIIVAIVALVAILVVLYNKSETVRNAINAVGSAIVTAWQAVLSFFSGVPGFFAGVWGAVVSSFNTALGFFKGLPGMFSGWFSAVTSTISSWASSVGQWFVNAWNSIKTATSNGISATLAFIATLPERIAYWVGFAIGRAIKLWIDGWKLMLSTAITWGNAIDNFVATLPARIGAFFSQLYTVVTSWMSRTWASATAKAAQIYQGIVSWIQQLPGRISALFSAVYNAVVSWMSNTASAARSRAAAILSGIVSFLQQLPGRVSAFFSAVYNAVVSWLSRAVGFARSAGSNIVSGIMGAITGLPGLIAGVFQRALGAITGFAGAALDKAKSVGSALWNGFKAGLGISSPSFIERAMFAINDNLRSETNAMRGNIKSIQGLGTAFVKQNPLSSYSATGVLTPMAAGVAGAAAGSGIASSIPAQRRPGQTPGIVPSGRSAPTFNVSINNPAPEPASDSLYRTQQKIIYLGLEGDT
jgi:TP901 family phage tail tape measure protein